MKNPVLKTLPVCSMTLFLSACISSERHNRHRSGSADGIYVISMQNADIIMNGKKADVTDLHYGMTIILHMTAFKIISVDLSDAPGSLANSEKEAVAGNHSISYTMESYDDLVKDGTIDAQDGWKNGVLFAINDSMSDAGSFSFNAMKWCSPAGADYWNHCTVETDENGVWKSYSPSISAVS